MCVGIHAHSPNLSPAGLPHFLLLFRAQFVFPLGPFGTQGLGKLFQETSRNDLLLCRDDDDENENENDEMITWSHEQQNE